MPQTSGAQSLLGRCSGARAYWGRCWRFQRSAFLATRPVSQVTRRRESCAPVNTYTPLVPSNSVPKIQGASSQRRQPISRLTSVRTVCAVCQCVPHCSLRVQLALRRQAAIGLLGLSVQLLLSAPGGCRKLPEPRVCWATLAVREPTGSVVGAISTERFLARTRGEGLSQVTRGEKAVPR